MTEDRLPRTVQNNSLHGGMKDQNEAIVPPMVAYTFSHPIGQRFRILTHLFHPLHPLSLSLPPHFPSPSRKNSSILPCFSNSSGIPDRGHGYPDRNGRPQPDIPRGSSRIANRFRRISLANSAIGSKLKNDPKGP